MCLPGIFVKLPRDNFTNPNSNIDERSLAEVLRESFAHKGFRLLVIGFFVCGFQITLIATHVPRYVQDKGLADWTGMAILALIGFFNIIGTLVMGYLGDKFSKKILLSGGNGMSFNKGYKEAESMKNHLLKNQPQQV